LSLTKLHKVFDELKPYLDYLILVEII